MQSGENTWNFDLVQNNDIYLSIQKNKNYKETEIIKKVTLNNFRIENGPNIGTLKVYRPSKLEDKVYEYSDEYVIDNELIYMGAESTNAKNLEIANQGGKIMFRLCNKELRKMWSRRRDSKS